MLATPETETHRERSVKPMRKELAIAVFAAGIAIAISGCAPTQTAGPVTYEHPTAEASGPALTVAETDAVVPVTASPVEIRGVILTDGILQYVTDPDEDGVVFSPAANITGNLTLVNGCLRIGETIALFPKESVTWDGSTLHSNTNSYQVGDYLVAGGGELPDNYFLEPALATQCGTGLIANLTSVG
jgi:hypothetical protein